MLDIDAKVVEYVSNEIEEKFGLSKYQKYDPHTMAFSRLRISRNTELSISIISTMEMDSSVIVYKEWNESGRGLLSGKNEHDSFKMSDPDVLNKIFKYIDKDFKKHEQLEHDLNDK